MNSILITVLNVLAVIIIIGWFTTAWTKFRSTHLSLMATWRLLRIPIILLILIGTPYFLVVSGFFEPDRSTAKARVELYTASGDQYRLAEAYLDLLQESDSILQDPNIHFELVSAYRKAYLKKVKQSIKEGSELAEDELSLSISRFYEDRLIPSNTRKVFLALHNINTGRLRRGKQLLDQVNDPEQKFYNYSLGRYHKRQGNLDSAIFFFEWELEFQGYEYGAYRELSALYFQNGIYLPLKEMVYEDESNYIHFYFRRLVYFIEIDIPNYFKSLVDYEISKVNPIGTTAAFLIAFIWLFYIRKLDIFEPERWRYVFLTFLLGAIFIELVYPLTDILNIYLEFDLNGNPINDFFYCFIGIGMVEELVKAIPLVIIVTLTKEADEPYDFILYASASSLGFAFIENISYIEASELQNINARMLTASVAHMSFSSAVAYGFLLSKFVYQKHRFLIVLSFFVIASLAHGFYDFWLINEWALTYSGMTVIFFIGTVHLWFIMKNNAINISNYFDAKIRMNNDSLKNYLILSLVFVLMFSYSGIAATRGKEAAMTFLFSQVLGYMYFILYLTYSFSRFDVVRGYLAPFSIPFDFMIPRLKETPNYNDTRLAIGLFEINPWTQQHEPHHKILRGKLVQRKTVDSNKHWYVFACDYPLSWEGEVYRSFLVKHHNRNVALDSGRKCLVQVMAIKYEELIEQPFVKKNEFVWISWGVAKAVTA